MIREPVVAGTFYPSSKIELEKLVNSLVISGKENKNVIGCYVPHAGYAYSGAVAGATISRMEPKDVYIIMGPSHTGRGVAFSIMTEGQWKTPLGEHEIDSELAQDILENTNYLKNDYLAHLQEHAIEVQLPFIHFFKPDAKIVPVILRDAPSQVYKNIGEAIAMAIKKSGKRIGLIASGDMTHYEPEKLARMKDARAIDVMLQLNAEGLLERVQTLKITMCGYAPAATLIFGVKALGANKAELVKYQTSGDTTGDLSSVVGYAGVIFMATNMSPQVSLAKETIEAYVISGTIRQPKNVLPEMQKRAGVFVSIHKGEELRGCIGTIEPQEDNIAYEIAQNAISAASRDPRFPPITPSELAHLNYSVDVLSEPELVNDKGQLNVKKYGVIVQAGHRRGLLLPDLEGVNTIDEQIEICRVKGSISPTETVKIYRFQVKRYF